jgi:hypothetical protein
LAVVGTVELHLAFAQEKQIERVTLTFGSWVLTYVIVLFDDTATALTQLHPTDA